MDLNAKIATRESYGKKLAELGRKNKDIVVDLADIKNTTNKFKIKISNYLFKKINNENISFKYYDKIYRYKITTKEFEITV